MPDSSSTDQNHDVTKYFLTGDISWITIVFIYKKNKNFQEKKIKSVIFFIIRVISCVFMNWALVGLVLGLRF